jgi:putative inorganic carbon (HCO3(-)) transporter
MSLVRVLPRPLAVAFIAYAFGVGATYNGILTPNIRWMSLALLALLLIIWLFARWRGGWGWTGSALDLGIVFGAGAIGLSLLANNEDWRRISIGIWFMALYGLIGYSLHDWIAHGWLKRAQLADALLTAGGLIMALGWLQSREWLISVTQVFQTGVFPPLPRPVSTLGNPNTLAALLVVLIPVSAAYALRGRGLARLAASVYTLAGLMLLVLTYSRGGWLGAAAGLGMLGAILIIRADFRAWWQRARPIFRLGVYAAGIGLIVLGAGLAIVLLRSLDEGGRGLNLRTFIYDTAVRLFQDAPLTGSGLFTFGGGLARLNSSPPTEPHSHAHNLPLHVAAELGIFGVGALVTAAVLAALAARRLLRVRSVDGALSGRDQTACIGACAALFGTAVHHMLDLPAMNPAVALGILVALVIAIAPASRMLTVKMNRSSGRWITAAFAAVSIAVIAGGIWSTSVYEPYYQAVGSAGWFHSDRAQLIRAREAISQAETADPALPVFAAQVGMISATLDDLPAATAAYERFIRLAPEYAFGWANLAALYDAADDPERAFAFWSEASARAERSAWFAYQLGRSAEDLSLVNEAYAAYARALDNDPDIQLLPEWPNSPVRQLLPLPALTDNAEMILSIISGHPEAETRYGSALRGHDDTLSRVLSALLFVQANALDRAAAEIEAAQRLAIAAGERAWVAIGQHILARALGDTDTAAAALQTAADELTLTINDVDTEMLQNIHYIQYLTYALPRQMVPQMAYPSAGFAILHVLDRLMNGEESR